MGGEKAWIYRLEVRNAHEVGPYQFRLGHTCPLRIGMLASHVQQP
jgi:hypothetical protein